MAQAILGYQSRKLFERGEFLELEREILEKRRRMERNARYAEILAVIFALTVGMKLALQSDREGALYYVDRAFLVLTPLACVWPLIFARYTIRQLNEALFETGELLSKRAIEQATDAAE